MNKELILTNGIFSGFLTCITAALGGWSLALQLLVTLIIADYLTGLMVGFINKELSSQVGFKGIFKKVTIFILIVAFAQFDGLLKTAFLRDLIIFFFISNEGLSLLENTSKLGVPYPVQLKDALIQLGKMGERKSMNEPKED